MLERAQQLEENIARLKEFRKKRTIEDVVNDPFAEWALRYGLFESIQIIIDIACHLVGKYNLGVVKSYAQCLEQLEKFQYIDKALAKKLIAAVGLRNLLIYECAAIDPQRLYNFLDYLDDLAQFVKVVGDVV